MFAWLWRRKGAADVERTMQAAVAHHEAGRLAEAEAAYGEVIRADPRHADALHFLGFLAFQRGEHRRAAELINRSLELQAPNPRARINLGNAYQALGDASRASECYRAALALQPGLHEAHYNLGIACLALGRREDAAASFTEAIRLRPDLAEAHYFLGHLCCHEDRIEEGLACFRQALSLRPGYAEARWSLALGVLPQVYAAGEEPSRARQQLADSLQELERWFDPAARAAAGEAAVGAMQPYSLAYQEEPNRELLERHGPLCVRLM